MNDERHVTESAADRIQRERVGVAGDPVPDHEYGDDHAPPDVDPAETVSICKGGCIPVWKGGLDECPECTADTRIAPLRPPESAVRPEVNDS